MRVRNTLNFMAYLKKKKSHQANKNLNSSFAELERSLSNLFVPKFCL